MTWGVRVKDVRGLYFYNSTFVLVLFRGGRMKVGRREMG